MRLERYSVSPLVRKRLSCTSILRSPTPRSKSKHSSSSARRAAQDAHQRTRDLLGIVRGLPRVRLPRAKYDIAHIVERPSHVEREERQSARRAFGFAATDPIGLS